MKRSLLLSLFVALIWGSTPIPAGALSITPTNLDPLLPTLGAALGGPTRSTFFSPDLTAQGGSPPLSLADLIVTVYSTNPGLFTYVFTLDPVPYRSYHVTEFNTGFAVMGFNGIAGYSFGDAALASTPTNDNGSTIFRIALDSDGTVDWNVRNAARITGFLADDAHLLPIRFFLQSTAPPTSIQRYNMMNGHSGSTNNKAPDPEVMAVPEPSSLLLVGTGLLIIAFAAKRRLREKDKAFGDPHADSLLPQGKEVGTAELSI